MGKNFDLHHNCSQEVALTSQTIDSDTSTSGEIIDTKGFNGLEFFLTSGTVTDGAYAVAVWESDDSAMSGATVVNAEQTLGDADFALADDDESKRIGTVGKLRYQQLRVVSTATTTGGIFSAVAVKFTPHHGPVAD